MTLKAAIEPSIFSDGKGEAQSQDLGPSSKRIKHQHKASPFLIEAIYPKAFRTFSTSRNHIAKKPRSLFDLPREIRDQIYDIYLGDIDVVFPYKGGKVAIIYQSRQGNETCHRPGRVPSWIRAHMAPHQLHKEVSEQFHRRAQFEYDLEEDYVRILAFKHSAILEHSSELSMNDILHLMSGVQHLKVSNLLAFYHPQGTPPHQHIQFQTHWKHYPILESLLSNLAHLRTLTVGIQIFHLIWGGICDTEHRISLHFPHDVSSTTLSKLRIEVGVCSRDATYIKRLFDPLEKEVKDVAERIMRGKKRTFCSRVEDAIINKAMMGEWKYAQAQKHMVFEAVFDGYR